MFLLFRVIFNITFLSQGSDVEVDVPANLNKYIEALLAFTTHSSQVSVFWWTLLVNIFIRLH